MMASRIKRQSRFVFRFQFIFRFTMRIEALNEAKSKSTSSAPPLRMKNTLSTSDSIIHVNSRLQDVDTVARKHFCHFQKPLKTSATAAVVVINISYKVAYIKLQTQQCISTISTLLFINSAIHV
ncbi:hypothetical protein CHUAL_013302 [Chamberlinius hualienensis]